ncbi:serine/threonine-protein phosphatase 2B regulatory subunit [Marchantia polymorpha subsp. ruderalis]|uniref:EF-hand domain-containing protein n=2 Tax=Marchantia polymorpha TaxID=3197 RepID=A0A176VNH8_MARPO|nr:hypothetical protein AXG93_891s1040 [Marchantia polymorpha subsp. ruderalis]PTQ48479.1 hypothetical protein MARPO_0005s0122 [Marchantia polymorpha]BBM97328.1 hypothetical protein Mp_1g04860 [Marchantia polymorpha subsp. ruderalis]|eukprot:PTQ48479.1 hypothetical protein MARPO_0005s0122 [Marchantia polymorpha]
MGNTSSMLTQYDIEDVENHCSQRFTQREIVSLYQRFCALDRSGKGYISGDEFMSVPEFAVNPLSQRLLGILEGLNFKEFVAVLSAFSPLATINDKLDFIFRVYDIRNNGKVSSEDMIRVLRDLSGDFLTDKQRQAVVTQALEESGYSKDYSLTPEDFLKVLSNGGLKMDVEVPID